MFDDPDKISMIVYAICGVCALFRVFVVPGTRALILYSVIAAVFFALSIYYIVKVVKKSKNS